MSLRTFAECHVWKDRDECERGIRRNFSGGGYVSACFTEVVKVVHAEVRGASLQGGYTEDYLPFQNLGFTEYYWGNGMISHQLTEKMKGDILKTIL